MSAKQSLRIGIVVSGPVTRDSLFVNEQHQAMLQLALVLQDAPRIAEVALVHTAEAPALPAELELGDLGAVAVADAPGRFDVIVTEGGLVSREILQAAKAGGAKIVCFKRRNPALQSIEWTVASNDAARAERYFDHDCYDEIWMLDELVATCRKWVETIYRCKVRAVPRLWSPRLLALAHPETQARFGFRTPPETWRVGIIPSNASVSDTFHVPALACNAAFAKNPASIKAVYVANTAHLAGSNHAVSFMEGLPIVKKRKMTAEQWFLPLDFMSQHCDVLVAHIWGDVVPAWFFEALHGDYPLVHNCEWLRDIGYYFPEFDVKAGGDALLTAIRHHPSAALSERTREFLNGIDPANRENKAKFSALVSSLSKSN